MKVVFMGTPDFAVPCLERLISDKHYVAAVFTREDKPVGRKKVITAPPVKICAEKNNIPVYQPKLLRGNKEAYDILKKINPDAIVVVAYGRLLPKEILELAKFGSINVHGSLLPKYRGASPIQWSIVSGEKITGVTTMLMDEGLDTGDMLLKQEIEISDDETYETLHDKMSLVGAELLSKTLFGLQKGEITPIKQSEEEASFAPIITKEMGNLNFNKSAKELDYLIRGFTPWPLCYFYYNNRRFKVLKARCTDNDLNIEPGVYFEQKGKIFIGCSDNTLLEIFEICPDGSKKMNAAAFINGRFIENNTKI